MANTIIADVSPLTVGFGAISVLALFTVRRRDKITPNKVINLETSPARTKCFRFMRQDLLTGKWTQYVLGGFSGKPRQVSGQKAQPNKLIEEEPSILEGCPFCESSDYIGDVLRFGEGGAIDQNWSSAGSNGKWFLRIVRNVYPTMSVPRHLYPDGYSLGFVTDEGQDINPDESHPFYVQVSSYGYNEVIVESPLHNECIALVGPQFCERLLTAMVIRGRLIARTDRVAYISFFKQHKCGSLIHSHAQIISTCFVPAFIENLVLRARSFSARYNQCSVCKTLVQVCYSLSANITASSIPLSWILFHLSLDAWFGHFQCFFYLPIAVAFQTVAVRGGYCSTVVVTRGYRTCSQPPGGVFHSFRVYGTLRLSVILQAAIGAQTSQCTLFEHLR
jgi:hypothetical protein